MTNGKRPILETPPQALADWFEAASEPPYRLKQLLEWVYGKRAESFDQMSNLPLSLRRRLAEAFTFGGMREVDRLRSHDGCTMKFLFQLDDGERIESVWMAQDGHCTFCISTQAGCALKCAFCATGAGGFARNLGASEILGQVAAIARATGGLGNIVFMGMGEPLLNLEGVIPAIEALTDESRFALGARRITVSTAGIVPGIRRLAASGLRPNLALSLNSPFQEQREKLMPVAKRFPLDELLAACADYSQRTGRRLMLEYVLLGGVNASEEAARRLASIARNLGAIVNIIEFNAVEGCGFKPPTREESNRFRAELRRSGVNFRQRYKRGRDIAAGCGQLKGCRAAAVKAAERERNG
jgi:23S rRNA (adenine2503-C2)-methyltransferase